MMVFYFPFDVQKDYIYSNRPYESQHNFYNWSAFNAKKGFTFNIVDKIPSCVTCKTKSSQDDFIIQINYLSMFSSYYNSSINVTPSSLPFIPNCIYTTFKIVYTYCIHTYK